MKNIVGRLAEQDILERKLNSGRSELIAVYGRRRVGKTYLIKTYYKEAIVFEMTGIHEATLSEQLRNFSTSLAQALKSNAPLAIPTDWVHAFGELDRLLLDAIPSERPIVILFDEFPWIQTPKSNFLQAFDHWWNVSGTARDNLKVVICGSAASWMIDKVINSRGGLHNRVTQKIRLLPFTLGETAAYLKYIGVALNHYQILQLYMAMGGIPYYLQHIVPGESAAQLIDRLFFTKDGILRTEFDNLFSSLFTNADQHVKVIRSLMDKHKGLTRTEIIKQCDFTTGGTTSKILKELEESGFITAFASFRKSNNDKIYKLTDEYSIFYQKFVEEIKATGSGTWIKQANAPSYLSWSGFAFESACFKHTIQIKRALGIGGVLTEESNWRSQGNNDHRRGAQIDLLLDRNDHCINICEIKFATEEFIIDKSYASDLDKKISIFQQETHTKKALFLTMITTYGVQKNIHYLGRVIAEVRMEDLFK